MKEYTTGEMIVELEKDRSKAFKVEGNGRISYMASVNEYGTIVVYDAINNSVPSFYIYRALRWVEDVERVSKYYLRDMLFASHNDYLNYEKTTDSFIMDSKEESNRFQTKFTDQEIIDLEIPIERFEKIEVGKEW